MTIPSYETMQKFLSDVRDFIIDFINTLKTFIEGFKKSAQFDFTPEDAEGDPDFIN
ncbi:MAG: hypothetical protein IJT27_03410 [Clostridia bacterium]|nr:hypothetical protein [Clostridia bacterium]